VFVQFAVANGQHSKALGIVIVHLFVIIWRHDPANVFDFLRTALTVNEVLTVDFHDDAHSFQRVQERERVDNLYFLVLDVEIPFLFRLSKLGGAEVKDGNVHIVSD